MVHPAHTAYLDFEGQERGHPSLDPVLLWSVGGELARHDEVGRVAGRRERAEAGERLVHGGDEDARVGVDAVVDFMIGAHDMAGHTLHRITNATVSVHGETATARAYVDALIMSQDNSSGVNAAGFYDDELARTPAGWRIARRRFTTVLVRTVSAG